MHIFSPTLKYVSSFKMVSLKLLEELRSQGTYSICTLTVLEIKKSLSYKCKNKFIPCDLDL